MPAKLTNARTERRGRREQANDDNNDLKIHISRVPTKFDEAIVLRILTEQIILPASSAAKGDGTTKSTSNGDGEDDSPPPPPIQVELVHPRPDQDDDDGRGGGGGGGKKKDHKDDVDDQREADEEEENEKKATDPDEHRGFGFVTFQSKELYDKAVAMSTIKGSRTPKSTKLRTMYLRPYTTEPDEANLCYLWSQNRCPYGEGCKFTHSGPGGCLLPSAGDDEDDEAAQKRKRGKCFAYKKGKCNKGDDCAFSHDFEPVVVESKKDSSATDTKSSTPLSEKDCINWKTKGKCRKGEKCPYRHDPELLKKVEEKKNKRKRESSDKDGEGNAEKKKNKQPLCVRVFGMAYDTTEADIRAFFEDCGKIQDVRFPIFEDSGRSKGYCGIWFSSPKAVEKAIELNEKELLGRWLSVQVGKMYLRDWEANHAKHFDSRADDSYHAIESH